MPYKDRDKQLAYMRKYTSMNRTFLKQVKESQDECESLMVKVIRFAREKLDERRKLGTHVILMEDNDEATILSTVFRKDHSETWKTATRIICVSENSLIKKTKKVFALGVVKDLTIDLLYEGKYWLLWEIIKPMTFAELNNYLKLADLFE